MTFHCSPNNIRMVKIKYDEIGRKCGIVIVILLHVPVIHMAVSLMSYIFS